ncbi:MULTISPECIES: sugar ABC transporter permease [unclassified Paenibacillus]|uniref:carbohydrate ABC transporter permease n=1 Tax=unclassified Paenibacillus TaxID=185978 RepID=UPI00240762F7|nr:MULTISPECIES: sugar ABC transporter permease [unclassified Paenibacillus]MDF9840601.1 multiple sugar transport system permease protein [Paenibacillus sp. PastF-2]MDF9847183.1 multiple sugar transport system permease protein [Paenibacillus sp. PastM-2]MDF9853755.1 multiple sugar transport system permease protein [Paenibacillus sp. PastF-1]MDH6478759.1 multiple sugar transport system permease protein [Paenibacillus sp. PastH-2]MDH6506491.1 multiple sugar transport system permease protein [Pae
MNQMLTKRKKLKLESDSGWGYAFIAVALIAFSLFTAYPVINAFIISLQEYGPLGSTYVGLENFVNSFADELFWKALKNTLVYTLLTVPFNIFLSFLIAILIMPFKKKTQSIFKAVYYLPAVASGVSLAVVWLWIFDPLKSGIANQLVGLFGIDNQNWLGSSATSMFSLVLMSWLSSHGTAIIIYLAALLSIDNSYYEAADIDGATFLQKLWFIVIPFLKPTTLFLLVTGVIGSFQVFQNAYLMTGGGPDHATTMVGLLIFNNAFTYFEFGEAAAQSLLLAAVIALISFVQFKFLGKDIEY